MRPPSVPLTSDTPRLHQRVLHCPVARRHANTLPTKAAQLPMALQHHERNLATRSAHTQASRTKRSPKVTLAFRMRLPPKVTLRGCKTSVSYETSQSHASSLPNERFVRDFLQKSHVKSPKQAFRTRLPQKVTRQVSKTSVSYEASSKTHMSKSAKRASRTRLPPKS